MTDMGQFLELILEKQEEKERSRALKGEWTQEKRKSGGIKEKVCPVHPPPWTMLCLTASRSAPHFFLKSTSTTKATIIGFQMNKDIFGGIYLDEDEWATGSYT